MKQQNEKIFKLIGETEMYKKEKSKLLKENMTGEESLALFDSLSGTSVGWDAFEDAKAKLTEYNRFLSMTYEEQ